MSAARLVGFVLVALASCAEAATPKPATPMPPAPEKPARAAPTATAPVPEIPANECDIERRALKKKQRSLPSSPRCLWLLAHEKDVSFVTQLNVSSYAEQDELPLDMLAKLENLEQLGLSLGKIPNLDALAKLPKLRELTLTTRLSDLRPVAELVELERLTLDAQASGELRDVSALARLTHLRRLVLRTRVDLEAVARHAPRVTSLVAPLAAHPAALARFSELETLVIGCFDSVAERLGVPPKLHDLRVECADQPTPLEPLTVLSGLRQLDLSGADVSSIAPLGQLPTLARLDLHDTGVSNLAPLSQARELTWLDVHSTKVSSLAPVAKLPRLASIDAGDTPLADVTPLAASRSLESLWLPGTRVTNLAPLASIPSLRELMVPRTCDGPGVAALHRARPALRILAWVEKSEAEDPSCF